jgi:hypothetical protein
MGGSKGLELTELVYISGSPNGSGTDDRAGERPQRGTASGDQSPRPGVTGNVAKTCWYYGITRQAYYKWLRRFGDADASA